MLTCWQGHHFGSPPVRKSPLWLSFRHGWLCPGISPFVMEQVHFRKSPLNTYISAASGRSGSACSFVFSFSASEHRSNWTFVSVIKHPGAKDDWHSCWFYLQVVTAVWLGRPECCEHSLSQNAPGALGHSLWNDTGMLIDLEISRWFSVQLQRDGRT